MNNFLINKKDRIFIAGSTGMAGGAVCRSLSKSGYGNKALGGELLAPNRATLDLTDKLKVDDWFSVNKPNVVVIAAAKVGGIYANSTFPADFLLENLKIELNIIEAAWKNNVRRLLFLGSSCIYPKYSNQPISEDSLLTGSLEDTNQFYALAKISGIKLCDSLREQYGFDAISLMPTNLYGPGDNYHPLNSHVIAGLIRKFVEAKAKGLNQVICWGTGSPLREFLHADDLGDAVVYVLEKWDPKNIQAPLNNTGSPLTFLNVGTGQDITISELATLIATEIDFDGQIIWDKDKPDGTPKKQLDITKISQLGWEPKITLEVGIKSTINNVINQNLLSI